MIRIIDGKAVEMTAEEIQKSTYVPTVEEKIASLKNELAETDYKAIKYAEGWLTDEEYAPIKGKRQAIRDKINHLEKEMIL